MKRSLMIQILDSQFIWPEGMAKQVLDIVEENGMMPPFHLNTYMKEKNKVGIELANGYAWEPEDE